MRIRVKKKIFTYGRIQVSAKSEVIKYGQVRQVPNSESIVTLFQRTNEGTLVEEFTTQSLL